MAKKDDEGALDAPTPSLVPKAAEKRAPGAWFAAKKPRRWAYEGARFAQRWPEGIEITEAQFDAAILAVETLPHGSPGRLIKKPKPTQRGKRWLSRA